MAYALPNLKNVSLLPEWQVCASGTCAKQFTRSFSVRLRAATTTSSPTPFLLDASYQPYALYLNRVPQDADGVRQGLLGGCNLFTCDLPTTATVTSTVFTGTTFSATAWLTTSGGASTPLASGAFNVFYKANGCTPATGNFNSSDVTIGFRGTLTVHTTPDVNEWTHYTLGTFDVQTPWFTTPNSTFCN